MNQSIELARRTDFRIGETEVQPSMRIISGPEGKATVEPRVMQVLLALYDAGGAVLSRDQLLETCWGGVVVGDDAINRTIAEIRRVIKETAAQFEIETITRVGYRFVAPEGSILAGSTDVGSPIAIGRRKVIAGGVAIAALAGAGGFTLLNFRRREEVETLIERGRVLQAMSTAEGDERADRFFTKAIELDPSSARAWGWRARVQAGQDQAREMAQRALELDPNEPNARAVLIVQRRNLDSWVAWEDQLLEVLEDDPKNTMCLSNLSHFYQGMGRCRDGWDLAERNAVQEPFNPYNHHRRAFKYWVFGRNDDAAKIADKALELWPRNSMIWNARITIFAYTDRVRAALAMLDDVNGRPENLTPQSIASWRAALTAIDTRAPADINRALTVCTEAARLTPGLASIAIMTFSKLGLLDQAYTVAEGLFQGRGAVVLKTRTNNANDMYSDPTWGYSQFVFTPVMVPFRGDQRFTAFCEQTGHVAYWRERGVWPDKFVRGSLRTA